MPDAPTSPEVDQVLAEYRESVRHMLATLVRPMLADMGLEQTTLCMAAALRDSEPTRAAGIGATALMMLARQGVDL